MAAATLPARAASLWAPEPDAREASSAQSSYPPLDGDSRVDVTVIGAGITGLSTAVMLKRAGLSVAVLEGRHIGAAATGHTSAKISLLQGTRASTLARSLGEDAVRDHVAAHRAGMGWLLERAADVDCGLERATAVTYSTSAKDGSGARAVRAEAEALRAAGLPVELGTDVGLPFPVTEAVGLGEQAQFDPVPYLHSLATEVHGGGSSVHEGTRVRAASWFGPTEVRTDTGRVRSTWVVVATGIPILDRSLHFARMEPSRSYSLALRIGSPTPPGMYLSADSPTRSIRTARHGDDRLLLVGGNGHRVGTSSPMLSHERDLLDWAEEHWPVEAVTHRWSAQDYQSEDGLPFIGPTPQAPRALVAFGFAKWGMSGGSAAAIALTDHVLGRTTPWLGRMRADRLPRSSRALTTLAQANAQVARHLATGWARPHLPAAHDPAEGEGRVETTVRGKVARCRVGGVLHERSAVCPHLGGIVEWNDAETSWDCPLHASRFAPDGGVLEGPATRGLGTPPGLGSVVRPRA
ncbi:FAD-dependent oxidoreductase [Pseudonocardia sp. KRD291]|uniref:FAD-dependent oxidoreductase n=1 Tax=Pseudonocardia sp. KRD291 TaxID=2792007 RepID=UPI001C4A2CBC|nr:FAD-dependent oxidoreductase [Pseudonocardia sp. KRD291]MBW0104381.1 FAD-dependent oxidoreductase [Pseudonocardia sp. KRD291]